MVVTYFHESFIEECLDSIVSQDYPRMEIVISDDASRDRTPEILQRYAGRHPAIRLLLNERNLGVTANFNRAFAACTGKYVALFAGDDVMLPGKLRAQVELMEADPECVVSYHDMEVFQSESGRVLSYFNHGPRSSPPREGGAELLVEYGTFSCASSTMVRRDAAPPHLFDTAVPIASDWLFLIETATRGTIRFVDRLLGRYRRHRGGLTALPVGPDNLITLALVEERYPHLRRYARRRRLLIFHRLGIKALLQGRLRMGIRYLIEFVKAVFDFPAGPVSPMW
jgi:glycosyltransferase involved in cell wall biosynthesis